MRVRRTGSSRRLALTCQIPPPRHARRPRRVATESDVSGIRHLLYRSKTCPSAWHLLSAGVGGRAGRRLTLQLQDLPRDHDPLDLARALVDLGDLRVAVVPLDRELLRVAVAAEDLDRLGGLTAGHLRREELRLRTGLGMRLAALLQPGGAVDEQAGPGELR